MTAQPLEESRCASCSTPVVPDETRCPSCGLARPTATGPRVLTRSGVWALGALLLIVWIAALVVVAGAR